MRLAIDATPLLGSPTGVGEYTRGLIDALAVNSEVDVTAFTMTARGAGELAGRLPVDVASGRNPRLPASALIRLWPRLALPKAGLWVRGARVVHGTNYVVPPTSAASVVTVHDLTSVRFPQMCTAATLRYPANITAAVERGAHVHVLTNAIAREVKTLLNVDPSVVHVVAPGLPVVRTGGPVLSGARRYVLALGTIEPRKDHAMLLRAFDVAASKVADVDLVIAGAPGWSLDEFDRALARMTHRDRVRVLGRVPEVERVSLLQGASVLAFPSVYEGFGLPPLEAMQLDVPVVATDNEAVRETAGQAALFSEVGDEQGFADNLLASLEDPALKSQLVEAGRQRIRLFDWADSGKKMVDLYTNLWRARQ